MMGGGGWMQRAGNKGQAFFASLILKLRGVAESRRRYSSRRICSEELKKVSRGAKKQSTTPPTPASQTLARLARKGSARDGSSDGTEKTYGSHGREFGRILKMPKTTTVVATAATMLVARWSAKSEEFISCARKRRDAAAVGASPRRAAAKTRDKLSRNRCVDDTIRAA